MKVTHLAVGDRNFHLRTDDAESVMAAAVVAREKGEWLRIRDVGGSSLRMLIPTQTLLVMHEREADAHDLGADPNDWASFDYDP